MSGAMTGRRADGRADGRGAVGGGGGLRATGGRAASRRRAATGGRSGGRPGGRMATGAKAPVGERGWRRVCVPADGGARAAGSVRPGGRAARQRPAGKRRRAGGWRASVRCAGLRADNGRAAAPLACAARMCAARSSLALTARAMRAACDPGSMPMATCTSTTIGVSDSCPIGAPPAKGTVACKAASQLAELPPPRRHRPTSDLGGSKHCPGTALVPHR